ncbi:PIG-L family deacetylase [Saccharothrix violaceirubra]|uniref:LmbE family N-acetylglucosaminyl deacetylase n=1 Tax=Saccharothrix violaceirubra TaxID=413306 RepID=A0A7W7T5G3_9PSEU|nr:PIG-L family deacetylase [Saccharothrix violaceirubra]MBB4966922.1 LmbE family N-acetylglucosaminyl deacetylase [Saccharothrix violaceirubra]
MKKKLMCAMAISGVVLSLLPAAGVPALAQVASPDPVIVQVVAHEDDDILFMNPDLQNSVRVGRPVKTIFVTAGENEYGPGEHGTLPGRDRCKRGENLVREEYAYCRQRGAMAAYALMADQADEWDHGTLSVATGAGPVVVDQYTLRGRPEVALVFLNLPEYADVHDDVAPPGGASLVRLWERTASANTVLTWGTLAGRYTYDHDRLVDVLRGLFDHYLPTVIRVQDPEPDPRYRGDHGDHVHTARFAGEAAKAHTDATGRQGVDLINYRDYNISDSQMNLSGHPELPDGSRGQKAATFFAYTGWDTFTAENDSGYLAWTQRMYHRYPTGTTWVGANADGRLQAFAVLSGRLVTWYQRGDGEFGPGEVMVTPWRLLPGVTVNRNADGRLQVFARRADNHEIVTTWQVSVNGVFSHQWGSMGNPNAGTDSAAQVGAPVSILGPDGLLRLAVKNGGGGVSLISQQIANGAWNTGWADLGGGPGVQDPVALAIDRTNGVNVFAYAINGTVGVIQHWRAAAGQDYAQQPNLAGFEPSGPPAVAHNKDGRLDVFYRLASNNANDFAGMVGHTWQRSDESFSPTGEQIGGHGGVGAVAVSEAPGPWADSAQIPDARILVFTGNGGSGQSMTRQNEPDQGYTGSWDDLGSAHIAQPAAGVDRNGCVYSFAMTDAGSLTVRNQTTCTGAAPLDRYREIE